MCKDFLVFDIWAQYAHFKKPYTTTSPLTFCVPPRTVITGILAAIAGIDKKEYTGFFKKSMADISVGILNPVKKVRISENLIDTKKSFKSISGRTQIKIEFLKNPKYRIYFSHTQHDIFKKIKYMLEKHATYYTLSLGLSENLANYEYIGLFKGEKKENDSNSKTVFSSVLPVDILQNGKLVISKDELFLELFTENMPVEMTKERKVTEFREILYERSGRKIIANVQSYYELQNINENIIIL